MIWIIRGVLAALGLLYCVMGAGFLFSPANAGADFGLLDLSTLGLASIRADFTAFFIVAGGCLLLGAIWQKAQALYVTAALMGIALIGRFVNLAVIGPHEGWLQPMIFEAVTVLAALLGSRMLTALNSPEI